MNDFKENNQQHENIEERIMAQDMVELEGGDMLNLETGEITNDGEFHAPDMTEPNPNGLKTMVDGKLVPMDGYHLDSYGNVVPCDNAESEEAPAPCAAGGAGGNGTDVHVAADDSPDDGLGIPEEQLPFVPWREGQSFRDIDLDTASFGVDLSLHTEIFQEDAKKKRGLIAAALTRFKPEDVDTVAAHIKELEGRLAYFDQELNDLKLKKEAVRIQADGLRKLIAITLTRAGRKACQGHCYKMERRETVKVEAPKDDEALQELADLDGRLVRKVEKLEADKRSIKAFLSRPGATLPGCKLVKNTHVTIK